MKKNSHHHNNNNNNNNSNQQQQHYFQVMSSNNVVGSGPNNYQSNYQQNLVQQQVYYTGMMNNNSNKNNNTQLNSRNNTSQRLPHNNNNHHGHHFNNNNSNSNNQSVNNGAGNYSLPQQYSNNNNNNNNTNYYSNQQHQMQYNNNNNLNSNERRNSYHSSNQQQHHHHHNHQQHHQQQQSVLSNLSNQNYSKHYHKPQLQKQISLPENDLSSQLKNTHLSQVTTQVTNNQSKEQSTNTDNNNNDNNANSDQKSICNYVNDLSPVYETKNQDVEEKKVVQSTTILITSTNTNTNTKMSTNSEKLLNDDPSEVDDYADDDECDEIVHVIENDDVYEDEHNSINDDTIKQSNLLTSASSSESSLNTNNSTSSSNNNKTLSDLVKKADNYKDKSDYYRHLVYAIDQLYPDCKWPLHSTWTFWFIKHDNNKTWSDNLISVLDVSYVEDFWSAINYLLLNNKSNLISQGDLTFFKKGIKPMWEDEQNKSGGCWLYQVNSQQQYKKVNDLWLETLLALIGDNYCDRDLINQVDNAYFEKKYNSNNSFNFDQDNDHICEFLSGTIMMHRGKNDKLALWTKNYKDDLTTRLIGKIWKHIMKLSETFTINFEAHETKNNKNASNRISYKE